MDHTDVGGAKRERAESLTANVEWLPDLLLQQFKSRIESFDMSHLQEAATEAGNISECGGGFEGMREWLLHQNRGTGFEEWASNLEMSGGGHCDNNTIHSPEKLIRRCQPAAAMPFSDGTALSFAGIHHSR
jgi:hypothetical protein